jgi:uncharacterized protein
MGEMKTSIPLHIQASTATARGARYSGDLPVARLRRVAEALTNDQGSVHVDLRVRKAPDGTSRLSGHIEGDIELQCQRCLRDYRQHLAVDLDLRLVSSEAEEARLMRECEPYLVTEDRLPLHEIIEDEILLALPLAPRCESPRCGGGTG